MRTKPGASEELGWGHVALTAVSITSGWDDGCRVNGVLGSTRKLRAAAGCAQAGRCSCPERRLPPLHPTAASSQPSLRRENPAASPTARFVYVMESKTGVADPDVHDWTFTPSSLQGEAEPALASAVGWEVALPRGARLGGKRSSAAGTAKGFGEQEEPGRAGRRHQAPAGPCCHPGGCPGSWPGGCGEAQSLSLYPSRAGSWDASVTAPQRECWVRSPRCIW